MVRFCLKPLLFLGLLGGSGFSARADDASASLPLLALTPATAPNTPSPWSGFYAGSEVFAISGKGLKGGVGGAGDFGYNHEFSNRVVVGVDGAVGYAPSLLRYSPYAGFDVAATNVKIGYDMGRFMPYVTGGVLLEKPHTTLNTGFTGASDAVNGLLAGSSNLKTAGTVGLGADYAITSKLTVGVQASFATAPGGFGPRAGFGPGLFGR
jgi:outer membrane immunogenic protein